MCPECSRGECIGPDGDPDACTEPTVCVCADCH